MIQEYALTGIANYLIANITNLTATNCKAMIDDRPDPVAKDLFTSIYINNIRTSQSPGGEIVQDLQIGVSLYKRILANPYDRIASDVYLSDGGLAQIEDLIFFTLNKRFTVVDTIRNLLPVAVPVPFNNVISGFNFYGVLQCASRGGVAIRNEDGWHGTHGPTLRDSQDGNVGLNSILIFDGLQVRSTTKETC